MPIRTRAALPLWSLLVASASAPLLPSHAEAIPAFARRYELPCHFCHDGYPKLSPLGEQFKERGLRLEDDVTGASDWLRSVPVSFRGGFRQSFEEDGDAETLGTFKLVSAGSLGSRVAYWIDESYSADGDGFDRVGVNNVFLRVEALAEELYLRGGRMELDLPFTQVRTQNLFRYEIYFANTGFETDGIGRYQEGVEAGGFLDEATRWSAAIVGGRSSEEQKRLTDEVDGFEANVYGRIQRRFGEDRAGAYLYWGRNRLARESPDPAVAPGVLTWDNSLFRLGADGSVYLRQGVHLFGTILYGRNSNAFADAENPGGTSEPTSFTGGFAQAELPIRDALVLYGRFDWVRGPPPGTVDPSMTFVSFHPGLRMWLHPRVRLVFEIGFRNEERPTRGAFLVEIAL